MLILADLQHTRVAYHRARAHARITPRLHKIIPLKSRLKISNNAAYYSFGTKKSREIPLISERPQDVSRDFINRRGVAVASFIISRACHSRIPRTILQFSSREIDTTEGYGGRITIVCVRQTGCTFENSIRVEATRDSPPERGHRLAH